MPQTVESITHAKAAGIPTIVAINKMDKPEANPERIKQQLTEYGLVCEEWGGDTIVCPISAKTGMGVDNLLEMLTLTAEVGELSLIHICTFLTQTCYWQKVTRRRQSKKKLLGKYAVGDKRRKDCGERRCV